MADFSDFDRQCMARALELAAHGIGTTDPNPRVGCVIAHEGKIVGEGFHERAGEALLEAARDVGADLLVMGAYGRSRFSEWALGGATRHVLTHAQMPVLMRH